MMLELNRRSLQNKAVWEAVDIQLPQFNIEEMVKATEEHPRWVHFGAGNIFRGFIAQVQQQLLDKGLAKEGIVAVDTFDYDIIDKIYSPNDCLTLLALMHPDGKLDKKVIASIANGLKGEVGTEDYEVLKVIFANPSLQMASYTITEKGYALTDVRGEYFTVVAEDMIKGPESVKHAMGMATALLYERYKNGAMPMAVVSMDNCSHNGEKLKNSVITIAKAWVENNKVEAEFITYLEDESKVTFPWSMIDKITPRPSEEVQVALEKSGLIDIKPIVTSKNTFIAPFVNAEVPQYLVVEDKFPNGRPLLEEAGVFLTDRDTVNKTETMKVTTCLNPLHTALAVYGCLLGYHSIAEEMKDPLLLGLVSNIGYKEGMPVVVNPKIIDPKQFIKEVIEERLPNPYIPDMPQRIATDTSQKVGIRFGETIKSYIQNSELEVRDLVYIPLAIAGWMRYLLGVDDNGKEFERSSDPMLEELTQALKGIKVGDTSSYKGNLKGILNNRSIFGVDLYEVGLGDKIEEMFIQLIQKEGAVRETLKAVMK